MFRWRMVNDETNCKHIHLMAKDPLVTEQEFRDALLEFKKAMEAKKYPFKFYVVHYTFGFSNPDGTPRDWKPEMPLQIGEVRFYCYHDDSCPKKKTLFWKIKNYFKEVLNWAIW